MEIWSATKTGDFWTGNPIRPKKSDPSRFTNELVQNQFQNKFYKTEETFVTVKGTFAIYESRAQLLVLYKNRRNKFEERKKERETERERDRERDRERESEGPSAAYTSSWWKSGDATSQNPQRRDDSSLAI